MLRNAIIFLIFLLPLVAAADSSYTMTRSAHPAPGAKEAIMLPSPVEDYESAMRRLEAEGWLDGDRTPPADPQLNDTWLWYIWDLGGMPVANLLPCTVRGLGNNIYVVVEDSQWNVNIDQADVDTIVDHFDNVSVGNFPDQGIWDLNTSHFGGPPNFDGLDRIFFLYYEFNISADGYFWVYDQFPDGSQPWASNEADVIYLATDSGNCASNYLMAVGAHEFEHLIHFNQDQNEESWLDEGMGELAMWLFGNPDNISSFNTNPDNSLVTWGSSWADYIQTYLWTLYIYEQFGGQQVIWDTVHNPINGMNSYQSVINNLGYVDEVEDIFNNWSVANYLDEPDIYSGQYGYQGDTLPAFSAWRYISTFPASGNGSVQDWASEYMRIVDGSDGAAPHITIDGSDIHDFRVTIMGVDMALPTVVVELELDASESVSYTFMEGAAHEEVVVSVASTTLTGTGSYTYAVESVPTDGPEIPSSARLFSAYPNPFNPATQFSVKLERSGEVGIEIFDLKGRRVDSIAKVHLDAGEHRIDWKAENLPSGVYMARLSRDGKLLSSQKLVLAK